ncbi:MAG: Zn-ribbon domain-containing OB-fold protein [Candidatus Odinarchaeia archaeon]
MNEELTITAFFNKLKSGKLVGIKCNNCGEVTVPLRYLCSKCGSNNVNTLTLSGKGTLESYTVIHVAPKKFVDNAPYIVGIIKLEEGPRVSARITDVNVDNHKDLLKIGMLMTLDTSITEFLAFKPAT